MVWAWADQADSVLVALAVSDPVGSDRAGRTSRSARRRGADQAAADPAPAARVEGPADSAAEDSAAVVAAGSAVAVVVDLVAVGAAAEASSPIAMRSSGTGS